MSDQTPRGWTTNVAARDRVEAMLSRCTSLPDVQVKLCDEEGSMYLFASGDKYYLWNCVSEEGGQVTRPTEYEELLRQMDRDITKVEVSPL